MPGQLLDLGVDQLQARWFRQGFMLVTMLTDVDTLSVEVEKVSVRFTKEAWEDILEERYNAS